MGMWVSDSDLEEGVDYCRISNVEILMIGLVALPVYLIFADVYDQPFRGFVAALSVAAVMVVIRVLRPLMATAKFWACIALMLAAHLLLIYFLPYTGEFRFGIVFAPLVIADMYLWAKLIISVCRGQSSPT